ncbi:MAG: APC family permease [Rubrobacter sp.]|nr:APC family permease [Rubrobacter sp.]
MSTADQTEHVPAGDVERFGYSQELKRSLTFTDLLVYGLIFMVPIAPFGIFGGVFQASGGMVALAYVIGMVAMAFTALSYAQMSRAFPMAGSVYTYSGRGLHPAAGFLAGWLILLDYVLVPALLYIIAAIAMNTFVSTIPVWGWVILFILVNTLVNYFGIETTAKVNRVLLVAEIIVLILFLVIGISAIANGKGDGFSFRPVYDASTFSIGLVFSAVSVAVLSFLGFDGISTLAEENREGARQIGRATVAALALAGTLFIVQTWVAALLVPNRNQLIADGDPGGTAFYDAAEFAGGHWLSVLTAVSTAIAWGFANALVAQAATSRLLYSMARDRQLPRFLAKVHPKHRVPENATFLVAAVSVVVGVYMASRDDGITVLSTLVNFGALTAFLLLHASVINHYVLREGSRNIWSHIIAPGLGFVIIGYVIIKANVAAQRLGFTWLAIGAAILVFFYATGRSPQLAGMTAAPSEGTSGSGSVEEKRR